MEKTIHGGGRGEPSSTISSGLTTTLIGSYGYRHTMVFPAILGSHKSLSKINFIKASNKHASAAIGENNTTYERLMPVHCVTKPNKKVPNSLVYSKGVALTNVHATLQKL
jgi:hypothetical protein